MSTGPEDSDNYWKKQLAPYSQRLLAVALLLPVMVLSFWFWRTPVNDPITVSALLLDRILEIATAVVLPVAFISILAAPWDVARPAAVAASISSLALGGSAILSALRPPIEVWPTLFAAASVILGLALFLWIMFGALRSKTWKLSLLAPLALLPAVQFWHQTSFVPSHLNSSLAVTATVAVQQADDKDLRGVVEVKLQNNGNVNALILASEVIVCFRPTKEAVVNDVNFLYMDSDCTTQVIVDNLSEIDSKSSWTYHKSFQTGREKPLAQIVTQVWYARNDRLRVDVNSKRNQAGVVPCRGQLTIYRLKEDAKFKGVVQHDKVLVFDDEKTAVGDKNFYLLAKDEPLCQGSRYDIGPSLGISSIRIDEEDWLQIPRT